MIAIGQNVILDLNELIQNELNDNTTTGGIILLNKEKSKTINLKVLSVSKAIKNCKVKVVDTVAVSRFFGNKIEYKGKQYAIMNYSLLMGVIENES